MRSVEEFIILGIATYMEEPSRGDDFTVSNEDNNSAFASLGRNVAVKFLSGNYVKQLVACCCGEDEVTVSGKEAEKSARNRRGKQDAADYCVRINNDTLNDFHRPCA